MGAIAAIFVNKSEKRMRAGWRILLHALMFFAFGRAGVLIASQIENRAVGEVVFAVLYVAAVLSATWIAGRFLDRRRFAAFGFHIRAKWWADLAFGLVLGTVLMSGIVAAMIYAGWATLNEVSVTDLGVPIAVAFGVKALLYVAVGINEELVFRGYWLKNISEGFSRFGGSVAILIAILISSILFGLAHIPNELAGGAHTTQLALFNIMLAGLMLAIPYLLTGELAISIGIHITWNLFQGSVFGLAVSGVHDETSLIRVESGGPDLWTGGAYGAEGGLLATIAIGFSVLISVAWIRMRKVRIAFHPEIAKYTPRATIAEAPKAPV
jgi:uncharacterized protein